MINFTATAIGLALLFLAYRGCKGLFVLWRDRKNREWVVREASLAQNLRQRNENLMGCLYEAMEIIEDLGTCLIKSVPGQDEDPGVVEAANRLRELRGRAATLK